MPRNRGAERIARSALDGLIPAIQEQQHNALAVDGYPVVFYKKLNGGLRCTCVTADPGAENGETNELPTEPGMKVLRPDGSGTELYIQQTLHGAAVRIDPYTSRKTDTRTNPQRTFPHSPHLQSQSKTAKRGKQDDPLGQQVEPFDTDDLFNAEGLAAINSSLLGANAVEGCGVCLGTGFVGGYQPLNGWRQVFDCQYPSIVRGASIQIEEHPNRFNCNGGGTVQFEIALPVGAHAVDCVRLWNNGQQVTADIQFEIHDGSGWIGLTADTLLGNCNGTPKQIKVMALEDLVFTHLEIQLDLNTGPLYVGWPRQTESQDLTLAENLDPVQIVLSPYIPSVRMFDVVAEQKNGRPWLITNSTDLTDRELSPHAWEATARLIQKHEYTFNLFVRRQPHHGERFGGRQQVANRRDAEYDPRNPRHHNRNR
jgi:hypothetical protein